MAMKGLDEAFRGVGDKPGLEIWCIVNQKLIPIPKSSHGKFFSGNSYIILNTNVLKTGVRQNYVHYWLGKDAKEDDCAIASEKAIELDFTLGSCTVQFRETQGSETGKFISYFRPCIIPIEGSYFPDLKESGNSFPITMFSCRGDHVVHVKEVPFERSSLNHNDVFIIDTEKKIFLFSGLNSSTKLRAKALDVIQYIKENQHGSHCQVATIEDGKFVGDPDAGEFWSLFGGYAPIARSETLEESKDIIIKLFWINKGKLLPVEGSTLDRKMLNSNKCYLLDLSAKMFVWMGKNTLSDEKKTSISSIEGYLHSEGRSTNIHTTFLNEGNETNEFKSYFNNWPQNLPPNLYVEGKEKVAAIFKQKGYEVKEISDDKYEPLIDCNGNLKVWLVEGRDKLLVSSEEKYSLYSGECYIVEYNYSHDFKDYHLFYAWFGAKSTEEDRNNTISIISSMVDLVKGRAVMAQVYEGEEPNLFFSIFKSLIIFKEKEEKVALFRIQGLGYESVQAIQVDLVPSSLNSSYCYILQEGDSYFTWIGSLSTENDEILLYQMLDKLSPLKQSILVREDSELDDFWRILGKKTEYSKEKYIRAASEDPKLFTCTLEKDQALLLAKKYWEAEIIHKKSINTPIYIIGEGNEPTFFTCFFNWDDSKPRMHGNSFERKLALIKGSSPKIEKNENLLPSQALNYDTKKLQGVKIEEKREEINESNDVNEIYPYESLKINSSSPVAGIDVTRREAYLSVEEFEEKFGMKKAQFYKLPKWRQNKLKSDLDLF
ncbi:hypothetical protein LUZ60_009167 [Juncus effusus]|nr:hypothetical protein LUZ60_009167 [Juncus effusus]